MMGAIEGHASIDWINKRQPHHKVWWAHANAAYELCPQGNGFDTHRIYETMLLGSIPIVVNSTLWPLYKQFPIVVLPDWPAFDAFVNGNLYGGAEETKQTLLNIEPLKREMLHTEYWAKQIIATSAQTKPRPGNWVAEDATSKKGLPIVAVGVLLKQFWWCTLAALLAVFSAPVGVWMEKLLVGLLGSRRGTQGDSTGLQATH